MKRLLAAGLSASVAALSAAALFVAGCESGDSYSISVSPSYAKVAPGGSVTLVASGWSDYAWSLDSTGAAHLDRTTGASVVFTAESGAGSNTVVTVSVSAIGTAASSSSTNSVPSGGYSATAKVVIE